MKDLDQLIAQARAYIMTPEERAAQVRSFAYGNTHLANPDITKELIENAARQLSEGAD
jgi:hypothetical protein